MTYRTCEASFHCWPQGAWRTILERLKDFRQNSASEDLLPRAAWYALALSKLRMYSAAAEELDLLGPLDAPHYSEQTPHGARRPPRPACLRRRPRLCAARCLPDHAVTRLPARHCTQANVRRRAEGADPAWALSAPCHTKRPVTALRSLLFYCARPVMRVPLARHV